MGDTPDVKQFGYRTPRYAFPLSLHVEIARAGAAEAITAHGIDISANGIAIAVSEQVPFDEPVVLAIRSGGDEVVRLPGRVFYQSRDHYGFAFDFTSAEQCQQIQDLISEFVKTE